MKQARSPRIKALWIGAAVVALGAALVALAGCTMIGDGLTGVKVRASDATSCVRDCNDRYKALYAAEQQLHQANLDQCQSLAQPDKDACLDAEAARHSAAMDALGAAKIDCQNSCHQQGTGVAG